MSDQERLEELQKQSGPVMREGKQAFPGRLFN